METEEKKVFVREFLKQEKEEDGEMQRQQEENEE
jgi:hypothetical protein